MRTKPPVGTRVAYTYDGRSGTGKVTAIIDPVFSRSKYLTLELDKTSRGWRKDRPPYDPAKQYWRVELYSIRVIKPISYKEIFLAKLNG